MLPGRSWANGDSTRTNPITPVMAAAVCRAMAPAGDGVRVRLAFELTGPLSSLVGRLVAGRIRRYLRTEADGLKAHCEA